MEKKTLSELVLLDRSIEQELIESNGELSPTLEKMQFDLSENLSQKIEGYSIILERIERSEKYYQDKAQEFANVARGLKRGREFLKDHLKQAMLTMGMEEVAAGSVRAKLTKCSRKLVIDNEGQIPESFVETVSRPLPARIKAALEAGEDVPGAHLEGGTAIRFYVNREVK